MTGTFTPQDTCASVAHQRLSSSFGAVSADTMQFVVRMSFQSSDSHLDDLPQPRRKDRYCDSDSNNQNRENVPRHISGPPEVARCAVNLVAKHHHEVRRAKRSKVSVPSSWDIRQCDKKGTERNEGQLLHMKERKTMWRHSPDLA